MTDLEKRKHHLESTFSSAFRHSIQHADLIGVVHDVSNTWTRSELHSTVLDTLQTYPKQPSFLVLNKVDTLKSKRLLLDVARQLTANTLNGVVGPASLGKDGKPVRPLVRGGAKGERVVGWPGFSEVFMVSSISGDGMSGVMVIRLDHICHL